MKYLIGGGLLLLALLVGIGVYMFGGDDQATLRAGERSVLVEGDAEARREARRPADHRRIEGEAAEAKPAEEAAEGQPSEQVLLAAGRILDQRGEPVAGARITLGLGDDDGDWELVGNTADWKVPDPVLVYSTLSGTAGKFELRGPPTSKRVIRLIAEKDGYFDCLQRCAPGSRGVDITLPQQSLVLGRLVAAPGTSLAAVEVLLVSGDVAMAALIGSDGGFRFDVPRGTYDLVITGGFNHIRLVERPSLRVETGDVVQLGDILVADTSIALHIRLDVAKEMAGMTGVLEILEADTEKGIAQQSVTLVEPATDLELWVPSLPVDLRCCFNGVRRLRYRIEKPVARLALEPGIARDLIVEFAGVLIDDFELGVNLRCPECRGFGFATSVKTSGTAVPVLLPEFGDYALSLTLIQAPAEPGGPPSIFSVASGSPAAIKVRADDSGPIRIELSEEIQRALRDQWGALR